MKTTLFLINIAAQSTWAMPHLNGFHIRQGSIEGWTAPGPDDFRGPCPMMNTLANHGFINHDGRNLTEDVFVNGLKNGLSFDTLLGKLMFEQALYDGSLSRADAYFRNNHIFNETTFEESISFWNGDILDANALAMSKVGRQVSSTAKNPTYRIIATVENFSRGEIGAPIIAFGDLATSTVNRSFVEYFFRKKRLPTELGWTVKTDPITLEDIQNLITSDNSTTTTPNHRRGAKDLYSSMF